MFAFGTDFVARWVGLFAARRGGFRGEDYTFRAAVGCGVAAGWGFDAEAEEHFATAKVGLGSVIEDVLFLEACLRDSAQLFYFVQDFGDVGDAELDFDFGFCLFALGHADSIERLLPKQMGCQHNLFILRALDW